MGAEFCPPGGESSRYWKSDLPPPLDETTARYEPADIPMYGKRLDYPHNFGGKNGGK